MEGSSRREVSAKLDALSSFSARFSRNLRGTRALFNPRARDEDNDELYRLGLKLNQERIFRRIFT